MLTVTCRSSMSNVRAYPSLTDSERNDENIRIVILNRMSDPSCLRLLSSPRNEVQKRQFGFWPGRIHNLLSDIDERELS